MSLAQALSTDLNLNLLLAIGFIGLAFFTWILRRASDGISSCTELKLHYAILTVILPLAVLHPFLPRNEVFSPAAKVWSAPSIRDFNHGGRAPDRGGYLSVPTVHSAVKADRVVTAMAALLVVLLFGGGILIGRDTRALLRIARGSFAVRKIGRVRVLLSDSVQVPFSYWLPGQANIVIPASWIGRDRDYRIALAHEIQHHRHGDTRWVYAMWFLKLVCPLNPAIHLWSRWLLEIQEFACDETLVDRKKVESQAYARCLVEAAQTAVDQRRIPVGATGLTFLTERQLLKRRVEKMLSQSKKRNGKAISVLAGVLLASIMGATAFAAKSLVQDRRVTLAQAQDMALRAQDADGFPVVVNERVLAQLNRYIGTPEGREFMRAALARMQGYKGTIGGSLQKYGVPAELAAVPITESGYQNLTAGEGATPGKAAGLWQFIPSTARNFGLQVDARGDERLDAGLSTDAALRYLSANHLRFRDWPLALLAYNMGEKAVQEAMDKVKTRDAWTLIANGYEGDRDYLARFMAAVLIMKNPESVR